MSDQLGRFGHHPNPLDDYCIEVEVLEGMLADKDAGVLEISQDDFDKRVFRAANAGPFIYDATRAAKSRLQKLFPGAFRNPQGGSRWMTM